MYELGRVWGTRSTIWSPAKKAAACSVPEIWQVPPPTPFCVRAPAIT